MASRIDTIRLTVPDGTPAGEYPTTDFDRMLHAPMIEVDQRWPLRPLTPTDTKPRDNALGYIVEGRVPPEGDGRHR